MSLECQERLIATGHTGTGVSKLSKGAAGHFGRDKLYNLLSQCYQIPMLLERVRIFIKYCEPCLNTHKLEKCPHEMQPLAVPKQSWAQIGMFYLHISFILSQSNKSVVNQLLVSL